MNLIIILCIFVRLSTSENVNLEFDINFPIIISDKFMNDSYFGLTVSLATNSRSKSSSPSGWMFIGAPKSGYPNENKYGFTNDLKPGVLWRCSLGRPVEAGEEDGCRIVQLDDNRQQQKKIAGKPWKESKEDNLLGFSLTHDNDRLITCAPKWSRGNGLMNGLCYWLNKDTYVKEDVKSFANFTTFDHRLIPFFIEGGNNDKYQIFKTKRNDSGQDWSLGQSGMSTHTMSMSINGKEVERLVIGAPGVRLWSGAVVIYTDNDNPPGKERSRANRNQKPFFSEYVVMHRGEINPISTEDPEPRWFDYFGYAVTSGKLKQDTHFYVGGSPRGNELMGEAVVFKYPSDRSALRIEIQESVISILQAEVGNFGSYFGSVLHSVDILGGNDDGADEIMVGAPLYGITGKDRRRRDLKISDNTKTKVTDNGGDHGAVYIFQYDSPTETFKQVQLLDEHSFAGARFGSAISSITKNSGHYQIKQLIIGAPYENCGHNEVSCGAVYIYEPVKGAPKPKVELKYRIDPSKWNLPIRSFGSSLSLGVDVDQNETPDLAIGAYKSKQVVVLRSRPPFKLIGKIAFLDIRNNQKIDKFSRKSNGLKVESCISIEKYQDLGELIEKLDIETKLTMDRDFNRFSLERSNQKQSDTYDPKEASVHFTRSVNTDNTSECSTFTLSLNKTYFSEANINTTLPAIKVTQELSYKFDKSILALRQMDIRDDGSTFATTPLTKFTEFESKYPFSKYLESLSSLPISPTDCQSDPCKPKINFITNWFHSDDVSKSKPITEYTIGSTPDIVLEIKINNTGETALRPTLTIDWEHADLRDQSRECSKVNSDKERVVHCNFEFIYSKNPKTVTLKFDMRDLYAEKTAQNYFTVRLAFRQSGEKDFSKILVTNITLRIDSSVSITGSRDSWTLATPFSFMSTNIGFDETPRDDGKKVELYNSVPHKFEIHLSGKSPVESFETSFKIPVRKKGSTGQIILVQLRNPRTLSKAYYAEKCETEGPFNFFHITRFENHSPGLDYVTESSNEGSHENGGVEVGSLPSRKRRSIDKNTKRHANKIKKTENMNHISCKDYECMKIDCTIKRRPGHPKHKSEEIFPMIFELYLEKNMTDDLLKETKKEEILIEAMGRVEIFSEAKDKQYYKKDEDVSQTLLRKMQGKVAAWVYAVAALIAVLLLAIIIFVLYKFGFFKRETHEKLMEAKADERRKSMMVPQSTSGANYDTFGTSQDDLLNDEGAAETEPLANVKDDSEQQLSKE